MVGRMANKEHLAILRKGVKAWNQWRKKNTETLPDLSDANLIGRVPRRGGPSGADLSGANLTAANLTGADFKSSTMADTTVADVDDWLPFAAEQAVELAHTLRSTQITSPSMMAFCAGSLASESRSESNPVAASRYGRQVCTRHF